MKQSKKWFLTLSLLLTTAIGWAQTTVKGTVVDATGEPLIGVTVQVVGQQTGGTVTDLDGNYTIKAPANGNLKFSYIGYNDQIIAVAGKSVINVTMKEDAEQLQEVVVVGYGSMKKESLTGAVTVVDDKMLQGKGTLSNPAQALQGQVPGVIITRNSAAPGAESWNMKIRGSFSANNSAPLVIIDGVESEDFSQLNPSDIESINFLKDASAAIYGSKAAGGVILVTTKKAKEGKVKVEYSGTVTAKFVGLQPKLMNLDEWCDAMEQARLNDGKKLADDQWLQYIALARQNKGGFINVERSGNPFTPGNFQGLDDFVFFDTDWEKIMWGTAVSTAHDLSVSGGSDKMTYRLSGRYMYDGSNLKWGKNNNQRFNLRLSNTFHFTKNFDLESIISLYRQDQVAPTQISEVLLAGGGHEPGALTAGTQQPGFPSSTIDGKPYAWANWASPNWRCEKGGDNRLKGIGLSVNESFKYKFNSDFDAVATFGYSSSTAIRDAQQLSIDFYDYSGTKLQTLARPAQEDTYYMKSTALTTLYNASAYGNWHHTFGQHSVAVMAGLQYSRKEYEYSPTLARNILSSLEIINGSGEIILKNASNEGPRNWQEALMSYYSRLNYDFKGRYLLEGNFRYDGSSKFQPGNRWAFFGGVSAGWRISEEKFVKNLGVFDNLKLRLSYGTVGNQGGIDRYDGVQLYNFYLSNGAFVGDSQLSYVDTNGKLLSTDRTWEVIKNYNIGLDFGVLNNRLTGTAEVFWKRCNNMLIVANFPATLGDAAPTVNRGAFKAHGWEGTLTWSDRIGDVKYHVGGTFTYTTNKLVDNGGDGSLKPGVRSNREGYPLNSVFGLRYCGKIQNEEQLQKYMNRFGGNNNTISMPSNLRVGDNMYEDVNGDGKLTAEDMVYLGTDDPKVQFSFNFGVEWKGFDLSVIFQGAAQRTIWRGGDDFGKKGTNDNWRIPMMSWYNNSTNQSVGDVWSQSNPGGRYPTYTHQSQINLYNYLCSSWSVEDGSYVRLKNITLGYNFPAKLLEKTHLISKARIYVSGADLWETSKIHDGWDPEASRGVSAFGRYPFTRNVTFGLNVTF
jgi:TonB-linked SusC/RagA family outer membrane protein